MDLNQMNLTTEKALGGKPRKVNGLKVRDHAPELVEAMRAVAALLEGPRDRLGRLDISAGPIRERVRDLHKAYKCEGAKDYIDQCAKVLRAALAKAGA